MFLLAVSINQRKSSKKSPMTRSAFASLIAILLVGLFLPSAVAVDEEMPSAIGHYQISIGDQPTKVIDFNARLERDGSAAGEMAFQDITAPSAAKPNGEAGSDDATQPFFLKANFDCLTINGNSAVMSGNVTQASLERYLGRRVLLVVQDNGHGVDPAKRDKLTWGLYRSAPAETTLTTDFERPDDQSGITWLATDAERGDDTGTSSQKTEAIGCYSFPLSAFSFIDAKQGRGNVQVRSGKTQQ
jgi:hypothetical protein